MSFASNDTDVVLTTMKETHGMANAMLAVENNDDRLKIRLELTTTTNFNREILLTVDSRSTSGYDKGFDAIVSDDHPNDMYWMLDDTGLVIQAIDELTIDDELPIGFRSDGNCTMTVRVESLLNPFPDMEIFLRDNETMDTYDILNETFEISLEEGEFHEAYTVVFKPKEEEIVQTYEETVQITQEEEVVEVIPEMTYDKLAVFVSDQDQMLKIRKPGELMVSNIAMYNILGQQVKLWSNNIVGNETDIPLDFKTGIYYLNMQTNEGTVKRKILIK